MCVHRISKVLRPIHCSHVHSCTMRAAQITINEPATALNRNTACCLPNSSMLTSMRPLTPASQATNAASTTVTNALPGKEVGRYGETWISSAPSA